MIWKFPIMSRFWVVVVHLPLDTRPLLRHEQLYAGSDIVYLSQARAYAALGAVCAGQSARTDCTSRRANLSTA